MTKRQLFYPDYTVGPDFKIKMSLLNKLIPRSVPPLIKHYENDDNELSLLEEKLTLQDELKQIKIIIDNNYDTSEIPFDTEDEWNYIMIENAKYPDADEEGELDIDDYSDDDDKGYKK